MSADPYARNRRGPKRKPPLLTSPSDRQKRMFTSKDVDLLKEVAEQYDRCKNILLVSNPRRWASIIASRRFGRLAFCRLVLFSLTGHRWRRHVIKNQIERLRKANIIPPLHSPPTDTQPTYTPLISFYDVPSLHPPTTRSFIEDCLDFDIWYKIELTPNGDYKILINTPWRLRSYYTYSMHFGTQTDKDSRDFNDQYGEPLNLVKTDQINGWDMRLVDGNIPEVIARELLKSDSAASLEIVIMLHHESAFTNHLLHLWDGNHPAYTHARIKITPADLSPHTSQDASSGPASTQFKDAGHNEPSYPTMDRQEDTSFTDTSTSTPYVADLLPHDENMQASGLETSSTMSTYDRGQQSFGPSQFETNSTDDIHYVSAIDAWQNNDTYKEVHNDALADYEQWQSLLDMHAQKTN